MPVMKDREYRNISPLIATAATQKRFDTNYYVEGFATTFGTPYLLYELTDGTKYYEKIDRNALVGADMSDVIMQYDHSGHVYARNSNNTLLLEAQDAGLFMAADLSKTDGAKDLYGEISAGMITKMSWAFVVQEEYYDKLTRTRTILKIKKVYDVSAVSIPANQDTDIAARSYAQGRFEAEQREQLLQRAKILKLKTLF